MGTCVSKPSPRQSLHLQVGQQVGGHAASASAPPASISSVNVFHDDDELHSIDVPGPGPAVSEEGEVEPFSIVISEAPVLYSYSDTEQLEDSDSMGSYEVESRFSYGDWSGDVRDSLELIQRRRRGQEATELGGVSRSVEDLETEVNRLKHEVEHLKNQPVRDIICVICQSQLPKMLFRPCRHLCCCGECARRVSNCPMCRKMIHQREEVFF